jgi:PAS domain S-box-containing protein
MKRKGGNPEKITMQKGADSTRDRKELLETTIMLAPCLIVGLSEQANILIFNRFAEELTGYKAEEVIGKNWFDTFIPPRLKKEIRGVWTSIIHGQRKFLKYQNQIVTKNKELRALSWQSAIITRPDASKMVVSVGKDVTELSEKHRTMVESEDKYRVLFESSSDAIMLLDPKGFFDCNEATLKIFGISTKDQFVSKHPSELSPRRQPDGTDSLSAANSHITKAFKTGSDYFEWSHKRLDGMVFPATVLLTRFVLEGRQVLQATVRDNTEIKKKEKELYMSAAYWQNTFDNLTDMISILDTDYRFVRTNQEFYKTFNKAAGVKPSEIIGKHCYEVMHRRSHPFPGCPHAETLRTKKPAHMEFFHASLGRWFEVNTWPLLDASKTCTGTVHITRDVTERKLAEETLRESESKFRAIFDSANDGMFLIDTETRSLVMCNAMCAKMLGYSREEFLKLDISQIHSPEDLPFINAQIRKVTKSEEVAHTAVRFRRKDGSILITDLSPSLVTFAKKRFILLIFKDITERTKGEEELLRTKQILESKIDELERFNRVVIERELKMVELKKRLADLKVKRGATDA